MRFSILSSVVVGSTVVFACACSPSAPPSKISSPAKPAAVDAAPPSAVSDASASEDAVADDAAPEPAQPEPSSFPPPEFSPPHARTAAPGDGVWQPVTELAEAEPTVVRTVVHPHPTKRFTYAAVVAMDLRRLDLRLIAGTQEPTSRDIPAERRPGLVPQPDHKGLVAVFNGGFQAQHGRYGMMLDGDVFLPPQDDACTVGLLRDGTIRIGTWTKLEEAGYALAGFRQTPPCLLEAGEAHPWLASEWRRRKWGGAVDGKKEIRRTALGLDATGTILLFGLGEEVEAHTMAAAMAAAGAVNVAQLDINWSYTRFLFFTSSSDSAPPTVLSTLIPKLKHTARGYVEEPSTRDFFYVVRKAAP